MERTGQGWSGTNENRGHSSARNRGQGLQRLLSPDSLLWDQRRDTNGQMKSLTMWLRPSATEWSRE